MLESVGIKLVDLTVSRHRSSIQVSAVVYYPAGTGIDECSRSHRLMQPKLVEYLGTEDFGLEVASPGIDRVLKSAREYQIFKGRGLRVVMADGSRKGGILEAYDGTTLTLAGNDGTESVPVSDILKAKLDSTQEGR